MTTTTIKLIAKPLFSMDKTRKITVKQADGKVFLMITPKRYIGFGKTLENAITDANCRTFSTGYRVEMVEA